MQDSHSELTTSRSEGKINIHSLLLILTIKQLAKGQFIGLTCNLLCGRHRRAATFSKITQECSDL